MNSWKAQTNNPLWSCQDKGGKSCLVLAPARHLAAGGGGFARFARLAAGQALLSFVREARFSRCECRGGGVRGGGGGGVRERGQGERGSFPGKPPGKKHVGHGQGSPKIERNPLPWLCTSQVLRGYKPKYQGEHGDL